MRTGFSTTSWILAALLCCVPGCGSDDDGGTGGGGLTGDDATAQMLLDDLAIPLITDLALADYLDQAPPPSALDKACQTLDVCSNGSVELCTTVNTLQITFNQCQLPGGTVNGTVNLQTGTGGGSGSLALTIGNLAVTGSIAYVYEEGCFRQSYSEIQIEGPNQTIFMQGYAHWCEPPLMAGNVVVPHFASFLFSIPDLDRNFDFAMYAEPPGSVELVALNGNRSQILRICTGTIGGRLSCTRAD